MKTSIRSRSVPSLLGSVSLALMLLTGCGSEEDLAEAVRDAAGSRSDEEQTPHKGTDTELDPTESWFAGFSPSRGVAGTVISLALTGAAVDCVGSGACTVTVGDRAAWLHEDVGASEVVAPPYATSEAICVTWRDQTVCRDGYTSLDVPVIEDVQLVRGHASTLILVSGEGFPIDAEVEIDGSLVAIEQVSAGLVVVRVAEGEYTGSHELRVHAPSHRRCGAPSEPVTIVFE